MIILTKALICIMIGFITATLFGSIVIKFFKKNNYSQSTSKFLEKHLQKNGTPTMGGIIFIIPTFLILFLLLILNRIHFSINLIILLGVFIFYAIIGFIDDYKKIKEKNNNGISPFLKFLLETILALIFFVLIMNSSKDTTISFLHFSLDIKWLYGLLILFMLESSTNAINITDGLDGLAGGLATISFICYGIIAFSKNYIIGYEEIAIFCFVIAGSLIGFLFYNFYPAKIFMGDLGSLSLGGTLIAVAILLKVEFSFLIIGIVYIFEVFSSLIQIIAIKYFHKRIFLKAPFHHHLEDKGYNEVDIIKIFYLIGFISSLIALIIYVWL